MEWCATTRTTVSVDARRYNRTRSDLEPGRAVDMGHGAQFFAPVLADRHYEGHEVVRRHRRRDLEVFTRRFGRHHRRERAVPLSLFDHRVYPGPVLGRPGIREDAAIAQRTRAELGAALCPAEHSAVGEQPRGGRDDVLGPLDIDER